MKLIKLILFVVFIAGCSKESPVSFSKPAEPLDELVKSSLYLEGNDTSASGVLIGYHKENGNRIGLTCYHFWKYVKGDRARCNIPLIFDPNKNQIVTSRSEAIHLEWDELTDLSLFMLASKEPFCWQEVNMGSVQPRGEHIIKVGFPAGLYKKFEGEVEYFTTQYSVYGHYSINIPVRYGDSGSPIFRQSDNKIIGIVSQMANGRGLATPNGVIKEFVEKYCGRDKYVTEK